MTGRARKRHTIFATSHQASPGLASQFQVGKQGLHLCRFVFRRAGRCAGRRAGRENVTLFSQPPTKHLQDCPASRPGMLVKENVLSRGPARACARKSQSSEASPLPRRMTGLQTGEQAGKQACKQTEGRQIGKQADTQADRQANRQAGRQADKQRASSEAGRLQQISRLNKSLGRSCARVWSMQRMCQ